MNDPQHEEEEDGINITFNTVQAMRLKMFSDAVWSIVATLMIVPIMHMKVAEELNREHHDMNRVINEILPHILLYFIAFMIICSTWSCHVWTFQTMKYVTDLSIVFNLVVLLAGSFMPYFYSLMSRFRTWPTVVIYSSIQIAIGVIQVSLILHAFSYPGILNPKIDEKSDEEKAKMKRKMISRLMVPPCYSLLAIILSFISVTAAIVCLAFILLHPWIQSLCCFTFTRIPALNKYRGKRDLIQRDLLLTERVKKERIEGFSDGVFAITSTLLILDINEKYLPLENKVKILFGNSVTNALASYWGVYIAYILTFIIIGLQWYTHLSLFKNLLKFSRIMLFVHNCSLACVGMIPLSFSFILHFKINPAITTGVQFGSIVLFLIGVFYSVLYVLGYVFDRCNRPNNDIWMSRNIQPGGSDFRIMIFQLTAFPLGSMLVFGLSFLPSSSVSVYVGAAIIPLYTLVLILWKTVVASILEKDESKTRGEYSRMEDSGVTEHHGE